MPDNRSCRPDHLIQLCQLRYLSLSHSALGLVVLTADATREGKQRALAAGAKDFVTKPFDQTEVLLRVKNLLETRALHVDLQRHNAALHIEIAERREHDRRVDREQEARRLRVQQVLDGDSLTMVFQPIVDLFTARMLGVEALARFASAPDRGPPEWFADAAAVGLGADLELHAVRQAVAQIDQLPEGTYLSVNVSPQTALDPRLADIVTSLAGRIVLELTEHAPVKQYDRLLDALAVLRSGGLRLAVDDAGSGYASLQHILRLHPSIIKLDIELIRGIETDPARRALTAALVTFGDEIGATITAEGIETADQLDTLRRLHVRSGQGFHLGRPSLPHLLSPRGEDVIPSRVAGPRQASPARLSQQLGDP